MNWLLIFDGIASVSQLGMAVAVASGVWVAYQQLHNWRDELIVRKRADVAEQLLAHALTVSDELKALRSPFDSIPQEKLGNKKFVYERRFKRFQERHELFLQLREAQVRAEAIFDDPQIDKAINKLFDVRATTMTAIDLLAEGGDTRGGDQETKDFYKKLRREMYGTYTEKHDPLGIEQLEAIASLKRALRPAISYDK